MTGWWNHEVLALGSHSIPVLFLLSRLVLPPLIHEGTCSDSQRKSETTGSTEPYICYGFPKKQAGQVACVA